ncbi:hypothetical protein [Romboutsia sp.]|uniref:hypothetical protein n=1 Tax=Romboutsia sp. TaxID=1965302 RepID=UPI003F302595
MKKAIITLSILCGGLLLTTPSYNTIFAQGTNQNLNNNVKVEVVNQLNKEQAKEILVNHNSDINYIYQGDEGNFEALKQKGLNGYVFLPDVETDLGFFVDKNTSSVYYFHPSGYLELAF